MPFTATARCAPMQNGQAFQLATSDAMSSRSETLHVLGPRRARCVHAPKAGPAKARS
jgi:hypothetical protein